LDDSIVADSYEQVRQALRSMNFEHYEVSNFALPGARSTHNMGYWLGRDYLGLGTGAYGTVTIKSQPGSIGQRLRYRNIISPERYLEHWASPDRVAPAERSVSSFVGGVIEEEWIDADMAMDEALMLGLRMRDGVDVEAVARVRGHSKKHDARAPTIKRLVNSGKLLARGSTLQLPHDQWLFTDSILRELL
jgi:oxygen-independent coproporphyrinogen-3 oxidase